MSRSKKTEEQIRNTKAGRFEYVGNEEVAGELQEIEFMPSTLETIDKAMLKFIDEGLNLFASTNEGFKKVPVLWVTAERAYQTKAWYNTEMRDTEQTLIYPLITVNRSNVTKEPNFRGDVYANLYPYPDARGGTITIARNINQRKTAEFQNAYANRKYGIDDQVSSQNSNTNKRDMSVQRAVYNTITIPLPVWVKVTYEISLTTDYQQQLNELLKPFLTIPGNSRMPRRITSEGHFYETFIDGNISNNSNQTSMGMDRRNFEHIITMEVLGYLIGDGENEAKPKIVTRENAVEFKFARERTIFGDIPDTIKDGFYRE